ncbi:MAG: hypothetical protein V3T29_01580 [Alphaproteobacteria bacterium]
MDATQTLIADIEEYCRRGGLAESTFGRQAVNDGKFVSRIRNGGGVTMKTVARVRAFMREAPARAEQSLDGEPAIPAGAAAPAREGSPAAEQTAAGPQADKRSGAFRFYDNRQKYLLFVTTCSEKWVIAERVGMELARLTPRPPGLRVFDAGMGDGTVLTRLMRRMHGRFPTTPFLVVGKEISLEDVRLSLVRMSDRFFEHPAMVLVVTNLYYTESPWLMPRSLEVAASLNWQVVRLAGSTTHEFDEQIAALQPVLDDGWQVRASEKTGNPLYARPSVLVIYREDHELLLDSLIPRPGQTRGEYDLILASQPYRARMPIAFKAERVLSPLARALAPGGRMIVIHSHGNDPGLEIIQRVWPGENPFQTNRHEILAALKKSLGRQQRDLNFNAYSDKRSIFRYHMHTLPSEVGASIGTSTLLAAWNAAVYVGQIEDARLDEVIGSRDYLDATSSVLQKHGGLWFLDESFVVSRKRS